MRRSVTKLSNCSPASCFLRLNDTVAHMRFFIGATYCAYLAYQSCVLRRSVVRRWRPWEYLVYFTSFITDISHRIIYLLTVLVARGPLNVMSQCCRKRRHSVARLAACQFMQGLSPVFAMKTARPDSSSKHSLRIDVDQSAVILVAPVIHWSTAVKDAGIARRRICRSRSDTLLQNCQSYISANGPLFSAVFHTRRCLGVTVHMIVRGLCF